MSDFIEAWQQKLFGSLRAYCGKDVAERIMKRGESITSETETEETIRWTADIIRKIENECSSEMLHGVMTACSCPYPRARLQKLRRIYVETGDVDAVIEALQQQLEDSLRKGMLFEDSLVDRIVESGWGVAGKKDGNRILITKIPKSGNLREYMEESDPQKKRELYCHCPRVRQAVQMGIELPSSYCLCGAGYYLQIWETILERKVTVEVLESVVSGSDRCSFAVHLPEECFS
ncbi:MAG: hypothetical protein ABFR50_01970 [Candidatus Fermentibacteria bacterium]